MSAEQAVAFTKSIIDGRYTADKLALAQAQDIVERMKQGEITAADAVAQMIEVDSDARRRARKRSLLDTIRTAREDIVNAATLSNLGTVDPDLAEGARLVRDVLDDFANLVEAAEAE